MLVELESEKKFKGEGLVREAAKRDRLQPGTETTLTKISYGYGQLNQELMTKDFKKARALDINPNFK